MSLAAPHAQSRVNADGRVKVWVGSSHYCSCGTSSRQPGDIHALWLDTEVTHDLAGITNSARSLTGRDGCSQIRRRLRLGDDLTAPPKRGFYNGSQHTWSNRVRVNIAITNAIRVYGTKV